MDLGLIGFPIRPAAIWAIGKIYEGQELPDEYIESLEARLVYENPGGEGEDANVKSMCAFAFGKTKTKPALESLRTYAGKSGINSRLGFYCFWAISQIADEPIPASIPAQHSTTIGS